jgi:AhpC/TSA family
MLHAIHVASESKKWIKEDEMTTVKLTLRALLVAVLLGTTGVSFAIEVGDKAPDFKLPATNGVDIALSDFRGKKWVLIEFYGADFAPT